MTDAPDSATPPAPGLVAPAIRVHAEAVVIRNGVPIDDDGNPIPTTSTEE